MQVTVEPSAISTQVGFEPANCSAAIWQFDGDIAHARHRTFCHRICSDVLRSFARQPWSEAPRTFTSARVDHQEKLITGWRMLSFPDSSVVTTSQPPPDNCRSVEDLPPRFRSVFSSNFCYFNQIQSKMFSLLVEDDKSLVICSPTGSGKTVLLELAIVRELMKLDQSQNSQSSYSSYKNFHVLYLAPLKAIIEEKCNEWHNKFGPLGIKCFSLTGDTEFEDYNSVQVSSYMNINILLATPEKFDHVIRTDPKSRGLLRLLNLVLIDEVHMLSDKHRGDVLEATITRIKTLRIKQSASSRATLSSLRYIAISATVPNVSDIATWLDDNSLGVSISSDMRPVKLEKLVLGYEVNTSARTSDYRFDIQLTYKLENIIRAHSENKPTIVFCSTRKSAEFTAKVLSVSQMTYFHSSSQRTDYFYELSLLCNANFDMTNGKPYDNEGYFKNLDLKTSLASGIGFYHSGLDYSDRRLLEKLFAKSLIPVLVSTSSLAMGVNLPAHLVIIKNTVQYMAGSTVEYDTSQVLQMIGRAGRPQFDTSAKAIIMTQIDKKRQYELLLNSEKMIESALASTLSEQLTVEIVLRTVTSMETAFDWISSTFLFIRILENPEYYGSAIKRGDIQGSFPFITDWCRKNIDSLSNLGLITLKRDNENFEPTHLARIVTRYSISLTTTDLMLKILIESYNLQSLLEKLCECKELSSDVILRVAEKRFLNEYNKSIRFKYKERIKTNLMKINCLLQATFQSMQVETSLLQDTAQLIKRGQRVSKCLIEIALYLFTSNDTEKCIPSLKVTRLDMPFETILSAILLMKTFRTRLWHDSPFVSKQLSKIGPVFSSTLVERGYDTFDKLLNANPRDIEFCLHRNPPFGSYLQEEIKSLPKYKLHLKQVNVITDQHFQRHESIQFQMQVQLDLAIEERNEASKMLLNPNHHSFILVIGCEECNHLIFMNRMTDQALQSCGTFSKKITVAHTKLIYNGDDLPTQDDSAQTKGSEYDALYELSSQFASGSAGNNKRKVQTTKAVAKKAKANKADKSKVKRVDTGEFLRVVDQMGANQSNLQNSDLLHCTYYNHKHHTIQAMVISESFAGIDAEARLSVQMDTHTVVHIGKPSRSVQSTICFKNNQLGLSTQGNSTVGSSSSSIVHFTSSDFSMPADDDDLLELLDDLQSTSAKSNDASSLNEPQRQIMIEADIASDVASELSVVADSSQIVGYSQFEDPEYAQTTQPKLNSIQKQDENDFSLLDGLCTQDLNMLSEGASNFGSELSSQQCVSLLSFKQETPSSPKNTAR